MPDGKDITIDVTRGKTLVVADDPLMAGIDGADVRPVPVAEAGRCVELVSAAHAKLGGLDVLINCATTDRFSFKALFFLSQAAHAMMKAQRRGKIVHIGVLGRKVDLTTAGYGVSTAGLAQLTRTMAVEWARDNIQVNAILIKPGLDWRASGLASLLSAAGGDVITGQSIAIDAGALAGGSWE